MSKHWGFEWFGAVFDGLNENQESTGAEVVRTAWLPMYSKGIVTFGGDPR
jgi:hypothetical protein